jgi:hypothetical protein
MMYGLHKGIVFGSMRGFNIIAVASGSELMKNLILK